MSRRCSASRPVALAAFAAVLFLARIGSCEALELEAQLDGVVDEVDIEISPPDDAGISFAWHRDVRRPNAEYMRFHVAETSIPADTRASLALRDQTGAVVREYGAPELRERRAFWTAVVPSEQAQIRVTGENVPPGFRIRIDKIAYQAEAGALLSTYGTDRKEHIRNYVNDAVVFHVQSSIAKLIFIKDGAPRVCTGFLLADNELMTNQHCVNEQSVCETTVALFGYQITPDGQLDSGRQYECRAVKTGQVDFELDFAVLELDGDPGSEWGSLTLAANDPEITADGGADEDNLGLFIIQHPSGFPKQVSYKGCGATGVPVEGRAADSDFSHRCDTLGGSSGSPVFDLAGRVVGLHHYGFADGEGQAGAWNENRAVRMQKILERLKTDSAPCP
jgi:V8-like Glu-specific endopeptidase